MDYATGQEMRVGDVVTADEMDGVVVCDFDRREFAAVYEGWDMPHVKMLGGGTLSCGVMVRTAVAGLIYDEDPDTVAFIRRGRV